VEQEAALQQMPVALESPKVVVPQDTEKVTEVQEASTAGAASTTIAEAQVPDTSTTTSTPQIVISEAATAQQVTEVSSAQTTQ